MYKEDFLLNELKEGRNWGKAKHSGIIDQFSFSTATKETQKHIVLLFFQHRFLYILQHAFANKVGFPLFEGGNRSKSCFPLLHMRKYEGCPNRSDAASVTLDSLGLQKGLSTHFNA